MVVNLQAEKSSYSLDDVSALSWQWGLGIELTSKSWKTRSLFRKQYKRTTGQML